MGDHYRFNAYQNTDAAWRFFRPVIGNSFGTAGLVAGLYLRSGVDPFTGYDNYTGLDPLELKDFAYDRKGFGIGKWKNWARKQSLYNLARKAGTSIYDLKTQMEYVMDEFSGITYGPVLEGLREATRAEDAAFLVYDQYLDIKKPNDEARGICAEIAADIYHVYATAFVKYVKTEGQKVRVNEHKGASVLQLFRKKLGYLKPGELYPYSALANDGKECIIRYQDQVGFVKANQVQIVTRMETM